jgi:hypothetical protein
LVGCYQAVAWHVDEVIDHLRRFTMAEQRSQRIDRREVGADAGAAALRRLRELVEVLDRRVPHIERPGEGGLRTTLRR